MRLFAKTLDNPVRFKSRFLTIAVSATGVTLLIQVLAFLRQLLIAACFGIGRDFDAYVMVYTVAAVVVFAFAGVFDSIAVPHLVRTRETDGLESGLALARSIFRLSLLMSGAISLVFLIAVPLLAPIFATGFSPEERSALARLAWYFLPWTFVCLPYYAAGARHKMEWRFNRVFAAEIVIVAVSIGFLVLKHDDIRALPIAYASAYAVGLVQLLAGAALLRHGSAQKAPSMRAVMRNIGELFLANQTAGLTSLIDRHMQSFLTAGGVSAVNYSTQVTASLGSILTFREIYTVPLTYQADRSQRLERLLSGLLLVAVPLAGLVACLAPELITMLLQRGHFDANATALTSEILRITAFTLITSTVTSPLVRIFQIVDRIHSIQVVYIAWAVSLALFGYLFVIWLGWGVRGVALMQLASGAVVAAACACMLGRCGIRLRWWAIMGWFTLAAIVSGAAYLVAAATISGLTNTWLRLGVGGTAYGLVVLLCYFLARGQLRGVVFGLTPSGGQNSAAAAPTLPNARPR